MRIFNISCKIYLHIDYLAVQFSIWIVTNFQLFQMVTYAMRHELKVFLRGVQLYTAAMISLNWLAIQEGSALKNPLGLDFNLHAEVALFIATSGFIAMSGFLKIYSL